MTGMEMLALQGWDPATNVRLSDGNVFRECHLKSMAGNAMNGFTLIDLFLAILMYTPWDELLTAGPPREEPAAEEPAAEDEPGNDGSEEFEEEVGDTPDSCELPSL